jgi:hypothetical protein
MLFQRHFQQYIRYIVLVSLLVEESGENHRPVAKLYHIMLYRIHLAWAKFELTTLVVIGTDCIGSYKSNNHTITTTTTPLIFEDTIYLN